MRLTGFQVKRDNPLRKMETLGPAAGPENSCSSTTSNSSTIPNVVRFANPSGYRCSGHPDEPYRSRGRDSHQIIRIVARKPRFLSVLDKNVRFSAGNVFLSESAATS